MTDAIAAGGNLPTLVAAIQSREARRRELIEARPATHSATPLDFWTSPTSDLWVVFPLTRPAFLRAVA